MTDPPDVRSGSGGTPPANATAPECPRCGSRWSRVLKPMRCGKFTRRKRCCQHCGKVFFSREFTESN